MSRRKNISPGMPPLILPLALLPVVFLPGVCGGAFWISPGAVASGGPFKVIVELRMLRMCAAGVIGASLALSGLVFQAVLRNPLSEPFILGVSGGAGVGAALVFVCGWGAHSVLSVPLGALAGALTALFLVLRVSRWGSNGTENLLLSGVIVSTAAGSILMYLVSTAHTEELASITWWLLGDLQGTDVRLLGAGAATLFLVLPLLWVFARDINALAIGDSEAWNLGVNTRRLTLFLIVAASLLAAFSVAMAGIIGFCGLIVPHIVRRLYGCDHRKTIVLTFLWGAEFLMLCDLISRLPFAEKEIPVGVITALTGAGLFLWLVNRRKRHEM